MKNPAQLLGDAFPPMMALNGIIEKILPAKLLSLVHMRISQINACSVCIDGGFRLARKNGESDERLFAVAGWKHAPYFSDAERAALALAESVTRIADKADPVPDAVWAEAARYFEPQALAALLLEISLVNVWNRLNVATGQVAGEWKP
jgi:AhpD family alkylhydroperoxidase